MRRFLQTLTVALATLGLAAGATSVLAQKAEAPKKTAEPPKAEPAKTEPMDINSATEAELATLKGIGEARAKAIVKGRPYKGKDDLVQKKIIPQGVYDDIKDQIIAKQAPKKDDKKK